MRSLTMMLCTTAAAGVMLVGTGGPAGAALEPDERSSCLAKIFQPQAVDEPQTVSDRILFIRDYELQGDRFGQVLKPLAMGTFEFCR